MKKYSKDWQLLSTISNEPTDGEPVVEMEINVCKEHTKTWKPDKKLGGFYVGGNSCLELIFNIMYSKNDWKAMGLKLLREDQQKNNRADSTGTLEMNRLEFVHHKFMENSR